MPCPDFQISVSVHLPFPSLACFRFPPSSSPLPPLAFGSTLLSQLFSCIEHKFPELGHSFLDSDRNFAHVETIMRRREDIYTVDEYCDILNKSANAPKPVVTSMNDKMCDVSGIQCMRGIKKGSRNNDGNKIELRDKVRWLKVT